MKIVDLDIKELIDAIGAAVIPVIFKDVDKQTPPHDLRERFRLNAEIMGRFAAVLYCGEKVGPATLDLISLFTNHMQAEHQHSMAQLLGPEGSLSRYSPPTVTAS
ncbi:hypothetical protein DKY63_31035 [Pseudomonas putida]|uniref:Uncharacterized protein n=1 Tax=Pseudomonas putida TaxID=303 RepID=A0A2Z4RTB9_PSEPU|nr:hypothetical protein [Pseudomonas putida]AWY44107.1 hypothetical protein DKY63_31035 [Pseudomonas putida]